MIPLTTKVTPIKSKQSECLEGTAQNTKNINMLKPPIPSLRSSKKIIPKKEGNIHLLKRSTSLPVEENTDLMNNEHSKDNTDITDN